MNDLEGETKKVPLFLRGCVDVFVTVNTNFTLLIKLVKLLKQTCHHEAVQLVLAHPKTIFY